MSITWDPDQYAAFDDERARPFADLMARVPSREPGLVVDLGCGHGPLTLSLAARWPRARIVGIDSSADMLTRARRLDTDGRVEWVEADLQQWDPADLGAAPDVIVTNATLQWVTGHVPLVVRWVDALARGGWFAMQVPGNFDAPSHALLRATAARSPRAGELTPRLRGPEAVGDPATYAAALVERGCAVDAWETTYLHILDPQGRHPAPVLEWTKGTALRPVLDVLTEESERAEFLAAYGAALSQAYPRQQFGTMFPFRRVFAVARKPA